MSVDHQASHNKIQYTGILKDQNYDSKFYSLSFHQYPIISCNPNFICSSPFRILRWFYLNCSLFPFWAISIIDQETIYIESSYHSQSLCWTLYGFFLRGTGIYWLRKISKTTLWLLTLSSILNYHTLSPILKLGFNRGFWREDKLIFWLYKKISYSSWGDIYFYPILKNFSTWIRSVIMPCMIILSTPSLWVSSRVFRT